MRALPRMRWLLIALGAIYAWTTPGEYVWSGWLAPTYEGINLGMAQITRLVVIAASLQLLLTNMSRASIFAGLHTLAYPLEWLGVSRDRIALRLTLTLEMMEKLLETRQSLKHLMHELQQPMDAHAERVVLLSVLPLSLIQQGLLLAQLLGVASMFWLGRFGAWV